MQTLNDALQHDYALVSLFFIVLTIGMAFAYSVLAVLGFRDRRGVTEPGRTPEAAAPIVRRRGWLLGS